MFKKWSILLLIFSIFFFIFSLKFNFNNFMLMMEYNLMSINSMELVFSVFLDWMSFMFMSFVCYISSMVLFYSEGYMMMEKNKNRFCLLVILFVISMMMMIISPNLISILLGWDGLGLVSYCLVIYYQNISSFNAGMLTALMNRVGDVALLMGIAWMVNFGSWNYIYYLEILASNEEMKIVGMLIILAAWTKSAQIPFSSWLPAAMAAPTPVSSLVHSSTLVTAGVYLLIRFNFLFSKEMFNLMLFFSLFTMFMSGLSANLIFDLKKIIALSTLSQLGLMVSILSLGEYKLAFFHLLIHAIFKALLFMCAGNYIHNFINQQDIRFMGSMIKFMPLTSSFFNISNLSLCGLPFLSGFYSKDLVVEVMSLNYLSLFVYFIFYLSIGLTVMYSMRLFYYSLVGDFNFLSFNSVGELSREMILSMAGLIFFVVFSGSMMMWIIFPEPYFICLPILMKLMTLIMISLGMILGLEISFFKMNNEIKILKWYKLSLFNSLMWNLPVMFTLGLNYFPNFMGSFTVKVMDQGWSEMYGTQGIWSMLSSISMFIQLLMSNIIKIYFTVMIICCIYILKL